MSEANNPEIDVDKLMQKIREEVAKLKKDSKIQLVSTPKLFSSLSIKTNNYTSAMNANLNYMEGLLKNAESRAVSRTKWPDNLNRFPFNFSKGIQKLALKILNFIFKDQREVNFNVINALKESVALNRQLIRQVETLRSQLDQESHHLAAIDTRIQERLDTVDNRVKGIDERVDAVDELLSTKKVHNLPEFLEVTEESYINLAIALSKIPTEEHYKHDKKDLFYYLFENVFYQSEIVKEKQKFYLSFINKDLSVSYPFLDAGCGRGEFLQNLTESNIKCVGIDLNQLEIETLKKCGFNVHNAEILNFLENTSERYCGISALQVAEHLSIEDIHRFLILAFEKLVTDGVIIIETVNPHSLYALSNFYQDSTHVKPLPPEMLKFLLEWHGFKAVKIIYSSLIPESARIFPEQRMNYQDYAVVGYKKL
ncbi:SAM-dependent methyltransferase [Fischerella thermalis CCMEE 5282]|uniref:methyltransferase domain-containing protein n=1 Tax=Fischerella thermalis TaxID=372787 RepID=UPI000C80AA03|nr:methyltransferase domain-containing protein [Fischerella thermalis]PMB12367.1 SAM-dependent methyltransferase [Fischerella thermalis CCMEE 5282]